MTFKQWIEGYYPDLVPITSNKLRDLMGVTHTEPCRRWIRGMYKPRGEAVSILAKIIGKDFATTKKEIDALS